METRRLDSGCRLTLPKDTRVCPVCDSSIDADTRVCPSCQTDLTLFDLPGGSHESADVAVTEGRSIDEILASIMDGKEDHREIIETLKSVARDTPDTGGAEVAAARSQASTTAHELGEQFRCPVCNTSVAEDATVCPGCGAEFSEGEATEYECPVCKSAVPADAGECPSCGVRFADEGAFAKTPASGIERPRRPPPVVAASRSPSPRVVMEAPLVAKPVRSPLLDRLDSLRAARREAEARIPAGDRKLLYRELPKLVNEVKPLLVSAKRIGLEIESGKRIISEAIQAGKGRDIERAVTLIADARHALDVAFVEFIGSGIERFVQEMRTAKGDAGIEVVTPMLLEAVGRMEAGDYDGAWNAYQVALGRFEVEAKDFHDARKAIDVGDRLTREVRAMGMDIQVSDRLLRQARDSMERGDVESALRIGRQAEERLKRDVPAFVLEEMRKARARLLDLKLKGNDLAKPIGILKEASTYAKQEDWAEALHQIRQFYEEVEGLR
jgi:predicted amidophosphoribosyltransferase